MSEDRRTELGRLAETAARLAMSRRRATTSVDLLEAVLRDGDGHFRDTLIKKYGLTVDKVAAESLQRTLPRGNTPEPTMSRITELAKNFDDRKLIPPSTPSYTKSGTIQWTSPPPSAREITTSDVLLRCLNVVSDSLAARVIDDAGAKDFIGGSTPPLGPPPNVSVARTPAGMGSRGIAGGDEESPPINPSDFYRDLTEAARQGKLDPVIGRDTEIRRAMAILCRREKGNPVLVGEAGVGKTAVVNGIAQRIASGDCPEALRDKRILEIDNAGVVAGTKYRGEFEDRLKALIKDAKQSGDIWFMDELHNIVGWGAAEGAADGANLIKPQLASGELKMIGATTLDEYRKKIEKDSALDRRFTNVPVDEPNVQATIGMIRNSKLERLEKHHGVTFGDGVPEAAAFLAERYLEGHQPDKTNDLLDECASMMRVERAHADTFVIGVSDIEAYVATMTGIPAERLSADRREWLANLHVRLGERVFGQEPALRAVTDTVLVAEQDLIPSERPRGMLVFLGPPGSGKTLLARELAKELFGTEKALIKTNGGRLQTPESLSQIIGSSPGLVGYDDPGRLSDKMRTKPYSILFIDEFHLVHPAVRNALMTAMEDGKLEDAQGREIDLSHAYIIVAGNFGLEDKTNPLGFIHADGAVLIEGWKRDYEKMVGRAWDSRADLVIFDRLTHEALRQVVERSIHEQLDPPLAKRGIELEVDDDVLEGLVDIVEKDKEGGRDIDKLLRGRITTTLLARYLIQRPDGGRIRVSLDDDGRIQIGEAAPKLEVAQATPTATDTPRSPDVQAVA